MPIGAYGNIATGQVRGQDHLSIYGEDLSVASNATATVVSYTVPTGKIFYLSFVKFNGTNIGKFEVYIDGVLQDTTHTFYSGPLFGDVNFVSFPVEENKVIELKVNNPRPHVGQYHGRIVGVLE